MEFVQCSDAIFRSNGHTAASHHLRPSASTFRKRKNLHAVGESILSKTRPAYHSFPFFAEDGVSTLCTGLLWNVISSKTTPGNPAEIRANGTSDVLSLFHEANEVVPRNTTIS